MRRDQQKRLSRTLKLEHTVALKVAAHRCMIQHVHAPTRVCVCVCVCHVRVVCVLRQLTVAAAVAPTAIYLFKRPPGLPFAVLVAALVAARCHRPAVGRMFRRRRLAPRPLVHACCPRFRAFLLTLASPTHARPQLCRGLPREPVAGGACGRRDRDGVAGGHTSPRSS